MIYIQYFVPGVFFGLCQGFTDRRAFMRRKSLGILIKPLIYSRDTDHYVMVSVGYAVFST